MALVALCVLGCTLVGRRVYATGCKADAARLTGVLAGILVSSRLGTDDPSIGQAYPLPAFSAAFLGSTQFRGGRFNMWGTVVAIYVPAAEVEAFSSRMRRSGTPTSSTAPRC